MMKIIYCEVNSNHIEQYKFAKLLVEKILNKILKKISKEDFSNVKYQQYLQHHRFIFNSKYVYDKDICVYRYNSTISFYYLKFR